jgi:hypothetical protein
MADDREPYEPLWAENLRRQPGRQPEEPAKPKSRPFPAGLALAIAALVISAVLLGVTVNAHSSRVTFADLPSYWGSVEMTCATWRIEAGDGTLEVFRCRPRGSGELPPGTYRPPETNWNSDFDRRPAADHAIRISASGEVVGWAHYRP